MENFEPKDIVVLLAAIVAAIPGIFAVVRQYQKDRNDRQIQEAETELKEAEENKVNAESEKINVSTALSLIPPLKTRIADLETQLTGVLTELKEIEKLLVKKDLRIHQLEEDKVRLLMEVTELKGQIKCLESQLEEEEK